MSNIFLEINGDRFFGFTNISITKSMENFCNTFSFSTSAIDDKGNVVDLPIRMQDKARIFVDDNLVLTGYVEIINIDYSAKSHSINYQGRDITGDLVDSSIIKKQYSIKNFVRLAQKVLIDNDISNIKIINNVVDLPEIVDVNSLDSDIFIFDEKIEAEAHDTIISFLDSYVKKVQALLMTNSQGNIEIARESNIINNLLLISKRNNQSNNILSANLLVNSTTRFYETKCISQMANIFFGESSVRQESFSYDKLVRNNRRLIIIDDKFSKTQELDRLANWTRNMNIAKGLTYSCIVQGFYADEKSKILWEPNTLVQIEDDFCKINGIFLIKNVVFKQSEKGSFSELTIVNRGTFTVSENAYSDLSENIIR